SWESNLELRVVEKEIDSGSKMTQSCTDSIRDVCVSLTPMFALPLHSRLPGDSLLSQQSVLVHCPLSGITASMMINLCDPGNDQLSVSNCHIRAIVVPGLC